MGDGACDPENLLSECGWDGGDCCRCTCVDGDFSCGQDGFLCVDSDALEDCGDTRPPPCPVDVKHNWVVENSTQAHDFARYLNCSGGTFDVEVRGMIIMETEIVVVDETVLTITGVGSGAVLDGGGKTRLFRVVNASLNLYGVEVRNGNATFGGAIAAMGSTLTLSRTIFTGNMANDKNGGAMFVYGQSNVSFHGRTGFFNNSSNYYGGAVYAVNSSVSWNGVSSFSENSAAHSGGALCAVVGSTVSWAAETSFERNSARSYRGGALFIESNSNASWSACAKFLSNTAQVEGGAIHIDLESSSSWREGAIFSGNTATYGGGGAMNIAGSSVVVWGGETVFMDNVCGTQGGAVSSKALTSSTSFQFCNQQSSLLINGSTTFARNKCGSNGGGLAILGGLHVSHHMGNITFLENEAKVAGGGVSISANGEGPILTNAGFVSNSAKVGGGVFITGSGTLLDPRSGELSATFNGCRFLDNKATANGGAIQSATGAASFSKTTFKGNEAGVGGALRIAGAVALVGCLFEENVSQLEGGQAISMIGSTLEMENCSFLHNAFDCEPGTFFNESGVRFIFVLHIFDTIVHNGVPTLYLGEKYWSHTFRLEKREICCWRKVEVSQRRYVQTFATQLPLGVSLHLVTRCFPKTPCDISRGTGLKPSAPDAMRAQLVQSKMKGMSRRARRS